MALKQGRRIESITPEQPLDALVEAEEDGASQSWQEEALEYKFDVKVNKAVLNVEEYSGRDLDWYHFSIQNENADFGEGESESQRIIPSQLSFPGMPHPRWWRLEEGSTFVDAIDDPDPNALSLLLPEFAYIDSNNWYIVPIEQRAGFIRRIDSVKVVDSFGLSRTINPTASLSDDSPWGVFTLDGDRGNGINGDMMFVPNAGANVIQGKIVEEINFARDEGANMVWAIEKFYEDRETGERINPSEVVSEEIPSESIVRDESTLGHPSYKLKSDLPAHWIPYVPRQINPDNPEEAEIYLRRARSIETASLSEPQHKSQIVGESWRLNEEEIPRLGIRVQRLWRFARASNGDVYIWQGRRKDPLPGHANSNLRFDYLEDG